MDVMVEQRRYIERAEKLNARLREIAAMLQDGRVRVQLPAGNDDIARIAARIAGDEAARRARLFAEYVNTSMEYGTAFRLAYK